MTGDGGWGITPLPTYGRLAYSHIFAGVARTGCGALRRRLSGCRHVRRSIENDSPLIVTNIKQMLT